MQKNNIEYLNRKSWAEISREERVFNAELYFDIRRNPFPFLELFEINYGNYLGIGFEVCFYRDLLKEYKIEINKTNFPKKRTFDLLIFSKDNLYIIETKSQQGFRNKQIGRFSDKENINKMFVQINSKKENDFKIPNVFIFSIISSIYSPKEKIKKEFDKIKTWNDIFKIYKNKIYKRADLIYNDNKKT